MSSLVVVALLTALAQPPEGTATSAKQPEELVQPEEQVQREVSGDGKMRVVRSFASAFGTVYVVDEGNLRALRFDEPDAPDQSVLNLEKPDEVALEYVRVAALSLSLTEAPKRVLVIGMGGGTFTRMMRKHVKAAVTDAVEIDPVVAEIAKSHFGVIEDKRTRVHVTDGAAFLASSRAKYDVIFLDAYDGESFPKHLATEAFFRLVRERLTPSGVAVMNLAIEDEKLAGSIFARWQAAFSSCLRVREPVYGNVLAFGKKRPLPDAPSDLLKRARAADRSYGLPFSTESFARSATGCDVPTTSR